MCEFIQNVVSFWESVVMRCSELRIWKCPFNLGELHYDVIDEIRKGIWKRPLNLGELHCYIMSEVENCAFNKVYRCHMPDARQMVFVKEIFIPNESDDKVRRSIDAKMNFLQSFHHPNVVRMLSKFKNEKYLYIVYEYFSSVGLYYMIKGVPPMTRDPQIKLILQQILSAVEHYHSFGIIHGDIKPEHILSRVAVCSYKLADFGFAGARGDPWASYPAKTSPYSAPELLLKTRQYSKAADIWSVGCVFGELVLGKAVFQGITPREKLMSVFRLVGTPTEESWPGLTEICGTLSFFPKYEPKDLTENFPSLEPQGIDLLSKMLCLNPKARISAEDALRHEYFHILGRSPRRIIAPRNRMEEEILGSSPAPERRRSY